MMATAAAQLPLALPPFPKAPDTRSGTARSPTGAPRGGAALRRFRQSHTPARENESASSRQSAGTAFSFRASARLVEKLANLVQLLRCCLLRRKRLHDQLRRRSIERALDEIVDELALCLVFAERGAVHVRAGRLVASHEPLLRLDLQQLEDGGIPDVAIHRAGDLLDGAGAAAQQHA